MNYRFFVWIFIVSTPSFNVLNNFSLSCDIMKEEQKYINRFLEKNIFFIYLNTRHVLLFILHQIDTDNKLYFKACIAIILCDIV